MDYGLEDPCSIPRNAKFLFSTASSPTRGLTQSDIQCVPGVKRPGSEADHSPHSS
jgi:hypothetical protein